MKRRIFVCLIVGILLLAFSPASPVGAQQETGSEPGERETYTHIVVKGDTLWDICEALYNNPWVWPKVWQLNPHVTNPHWIYPGTKLLVYYELPKSWETFRAVEEAAVVPPPPPPPPGPPSIHFSEIDRVGFITPNRPEGLGLIVGEINEKYLIAADDAVYVQFRQAEQARVGDRYFIFETSDLFRHPTTDEKVGHLNTILGILEITDAAPDHAKATVVASYDAITAGAKLLPYEKRSEEIIFRDGTEPKEGNIILSMGQRYLMGKRQVVFIDLGESDDIAPGHRFQVFRKRRAMNFLTGDSELVLSVQPIGEILVLAVQQDTAAALVTESLIEFVPGEHVRIKMQN